MFIRSCLIFLLVIVNKLAAICRGEDTKFCNVYVLVFTPETHQISRYLAKEVVNRFSKKVLASNPLGDYKIL